MEYLPKYYTSDLCPVKRPHIISDDTTFALQIVFHMVFF